jgi:hypothetical protein
VKRRASCRERGVLEMIRSIMFSLVLLLPGCSLLDGVPEKAVLDTLCLTAERKTWSVNDASETIQDAKAWNRQIEGHCGVAGKVASRYADTGTTDPTAAEERTSRAQV